MREIRTYGSVRGARSNARPYRDPHFLNDGSVKAQEAEAIASVLGKAYKTKSRSAIGITYQTAKEKFLEMGACSACADNIAQHYSRDPGSPCGTLAKQALDGDQDAIRKLLAFPDFCKWKYE